MRTYGNVTCNKRKSRLDIQVEPHVAIRIKRVFGKIDEWQYGTLSISTTPENCFDLCWFMERYPLVVSPEAQFLYEKAKVYQERATLVEQLLAGQVEPRNFSLKLPPRSYQSEAATMWLTTHGLLLADDVGLGKTCSAITGLTEPATLPCLVVSLAHMPWQWQKEIEKFSDLTSHILRKGHPYDILRYTDNKFPDVIICNYHKLSGWAETIAPLIKSVVFDEVQELRHSGSQKYKAAKHIANSADYRLGLSATPIYNYGGEIWNVLDVLCPNILGTWNEFSREWCEFKYGDKPTISDPPAFSKYAMESGLMLRRTRKDVKRELPEVTNVIQPVEVDPDILNKMKGQAIELAKLILRQQQDFKGQKMQAAGEFDLRMRQATGIAKAPFVAEFIRFLIESNDEPVIVGVWHRECFGKGTPVLMYDGTIKPVEEVLVGDRVMGPDSNPRTVLSLTRGHGTRYQVIPKKGESWVCSANHILALHNRAHKKGKYVRIPASEFKQLGKRNQANHTLYRAEAVRFPLQRVIIEPWLLGYWLGDGNSYLSSLRISTADKEVVAEAEGICARYGLRLHPYPNKKSKCQFYAFSSEVSGVWGRNPLQSHFKSLGLHNNKHIPLMYKTASIAERRELLAGLLDSDGHVYKNACGADITSKWRKLAEDIAFLCRSLGLSAYIHPVDRTTSKSKGQVKRYFRVSISGDLTDIPVRIKRKEAQPRRQIKNVLHVGFNLEQIEDGEYFGFEVDGDHLFLLGDFTVVHNCYSILMEKLKDFNPVMYSGSESPTQKEASKQAFLSGKSKVMLISLRAGAGMDGLQNICHVVVKAELDWSPGVHKQFVGRVHRDGQDDPVTVYWVLSDKGSDPVMSEVLGIKTQQIEGIINPNQELVTELQVDEDYIKKMAQAYLLEHGVDVTKET